MQPRQGAMPPIRAHLLRWRPRPGAQRRRRRLRLAPGLRAPPRSWTFSTPWRPRRGVG